MLSCSKFMLFKLNLAKHFQALIKSKTFNYQLISIVSYNLFLLENMMQKYLFSAIIASCLFFLIGCQTNNTISPMFNYYPAPQMTLAQSVQDALMRTGDPGISQVRVESNQNVVMLSGYVKKIRQSDVAEQIARQVPGVKTVENHIIVRP